MPSEHRETGLEGMAASFLPTMGEEDDEAPDPVPGTIIEVREDGWPDKGVTQTRVVLDCGANGEVDTAKVRVEVLG